MKVAFLFPGQGSQYVGMGAKLIEASESARRIFNEAERVLGFDVAALCKDGPDERLNLTEFTQPSILTVSAAALVVATERGLSASVVAGHSLGEYTALVYSGGLSFPDAVALVRKRGRYMQDAVPAGTGAMAAILGLDRASVEAVCSEASVNGIVSAANINSPAQIVIAGEKAAVEAAMALAREKGAKRVLPLSVSVPSHCALMKPAADRLSRDLEGVRFSPLKIPVVTNVSAVPINSGEQAKKALVNQLEQPVLWVGSIERMLGDGVTTFVEIGPGTVLSGLVKRIAKGARIFNIEDPESLEATVRALAS